LGGEEGRATAQAASRTPARNSRVPQGSPLELRVPTASLVPSERPPPPAQTRAQPWTNNTGGGRTLLSLTELWATGQRARRWRRGTGEGYTSVLWSTGTTTPVSALASSMWRLPRIPHDNRSCPSRAAKEGGDELTGGSRKSVMRARTIERNTSD
jgi:hypothetical protein